MTGGVGRAWILPLLGVTLLLAGCDVGEPCPPVADDVVTLVLTFDDGPVPADVPAPERAADPADLLKPLCRILDVLESRGLTAVFFVAGPATPEAEAALKPVFADGLAAIHDRGHILGYHAFHHDPAIWIQPFTPRDTAVEVMSRDLDALAEFIDETLAPTGLAQADLFQPVFRQPFGGAGISRIPARIAANRRGWTHRGFRIDSFDWSVHVSPCPAEPPPTSCNQQRVDLVLQHLRAGAADNTGTGVVDVLLHVNYLTADHLDEWIDELTTAFETAGRSVLFDVPACYLENDDLHVDFDPLDLLAILPILGR